MVNITIFYKQYLVYYLHKNIQNMNNYQLLALFILLKHAAQIEKIDVLHSAKRPKNAKKFFFSSTISLKMAEAPNPKCSAKLLFFHSPIMLRKFL